MLKARSMKLLAANLACASIIAGVTAPVAIAQEQPPAAAQANPSTITQDKGMIVVHKHEQPATPGQPGNGKRLTIPPANPLKGVKFKVEKVKNIDLKTNAGWAAAAKKIEDYKKGTPIPPAELEQQGTEQATNNNGTAAFQNLPLGLYLVTESDVSEAMKPSGEKVNPVPARPFLVTVPLTDPDARNTWMYNIHVYPKNSVVDVTKTVEDAKKNLGDVITYTAETAIPAGDTLSKYVITDPLASGLEYQPNGADSATLELTPSDAGTIAASDYDVNYDNSKKILKVTFNDAGRAKLVQAKKKNTNAKVKLTFGAKVVKIAEGSNNSIQNTVYLAPSVEYADTPEVPEGGLPPIPSVPTNPPGNPPTYTTPPSPDGSTPPTWPGVPPTGGQPPAPPVPPSPEGTPPAGTVPPLPSEPVVTKFGKIKFKKTNQSDAGLPGAEFKVALCETPTKFLGLGDTAEGGKVFTTGADGTFTIEGLHVSDFKNNAADTGYNDQNKQYCLTETKAPEGYERLPEPIRFNVATGENGATIEFGSNIVNYPQNGGYRLPLTGSNVLVVLTLGGALLILGGGFVLIANRRKSA